MRLTAVGLLLAISAHPPIRLSAQADPSTPLPSRDERFTIHSAILGEDREIRVHLPVGWNAGGRFDVVYVLDGTTLPFVVGGVMDYRVSYEAPPKVVVVGIANNSYESRWRDFTPVTELASPGEPPQGGAANFIRFLETEVIPTVARRYPVTRYRTLVGHSLGGLLVLHLLATRPDLFEKYVALSPVIPYAREQVLTSLAAKLPTLRDTVALYVSIGAEQDGFPEGLDHLESLLRDRAPRNLRWKSERFPALGHMESVGPGVSDGLLFLFGAGH